jgi:hypothetical protein
MLQYIAAITLVVINMSFLPILYIPYLIIYQYNNQLQYFIHGDFFLHLIVLVSVNQPLGVQVSQPLLSLLYYFQFMQV